MNKKQMIIASLIFLSTFSRLFSACFPPVPQSEFSFSQPLPTPDEDMMTVLETCGPIIPINLSEVIRNTITLRPQTGIQVEDVTIQRGVVQQNAGPFDWLTDLEFSQNNLTDVFVIGLQSNLDGSISRGILQESKKFRTGTEVTLSFEADTTNNPSSILIPTFSNAIINFRVLQPVLRGFLYGQDTITERASKYELKAVYYDALHNISDLIRQSLIAYWDVVRSQKVLKVLKESVESFETLANKTQRLIDEDQLARSEINQPLAQLAAEQINLKLAEQRLYTDVQNLKFSMGTVAIDCFSDSLLYAVNSFPNVEEDLDVCKIMKTLTGYALKHRLDNLASEIRIEELAVLVKGAENQRLPRLDFFYDFFLRQIKRGEGSRYFFSSYDFPDPQRDNAVGIIFSYPLCNNAARGLYRSLKAEWRRQMLRTDELSQQIVAEVMDAWMNHIRLQQELKSATESVNRFQQLVTDENKRLSEGIGSLFNLVEFQTRLTQAQTREINIKRDLGENLANLHFFTGSLLRPGSNLCSIDVEDVTDIPFVECCR
ncbi:MAG: hypothetical protein K940chlam3_01728 [Chlamydiae bacterium]|nr:hypothetical protein [Chlamydiota bacterium]